MMILKARSKERAFFMLTKQQINTYTPTAAIRWVSYSSLTLIGLIGVLPFVNPFHPAPLANFYSEWLAIFLGLAACLAFLMRPFWLSLAIPQTAIFAFSLVVVFAIQGILLQRPYTAQLLIPGLYLSWAILLIVLAAWLRQCLGKEKIVEVLAWFMVVGGVLSAFTGLVQYIGFGGWLSQFVAFKQGAAIYGNIAQSNHFATHILLATAGLCYLFSRNRFSSVLTISLLTFFAFIASLSGSRSVYLYAFALCALSFVSYIRTRDSVNARLCFVTIFFFIIYAGAQYLLELIHPWLMEQLKDWSLNTDPFAYSTALEKLIAMPMDLEVRASEWHKAWLMFLDAPVFGVGVGNYAWHSFNYQLLPEFSGTLKSSLFGHSHNLFAQVLAEVGIVGFLLLLLLLVSWVMQFSENWSRPDWFIAAILLIIFIHSNLEFPLWYSYFLGITAFLLGLGDARSFKAKFTPLLGQVGIGLGLLLGFSILANTLLGFRSLTDIPLKYYLLPTQENIDTALTAAKNPLLTPHAELVLTAMMPPTRDGIEEKIAITTRAFHRNPDSYKTYIHATFLALNDQMDEARALLHQAARAYPHALQPFIDQRRNAPQEEIQILLVEARKLAHALESAPVPAGNLR
ncbi:MAG: O-antigen ligase C-terminal domain-containing protein [Gammaproteobacteria bacterium]|nr:O-antigen ligase C-terminal domain-containing protein [Gammaproteobacteria bacterium]